MSRDPELATRQYTEQKRLYRIRVHGGLHYIQGNRAPYFGITADIDWKVGFIWCEHAGGCCHDDIENQFPGRFTDLIALHMASIDGEPINAVDNGWYFARGGGWFPSGGWMPLDGPTYRVPATFDDRVATIKRLFRCDADTAFELVTWGEMSVNQDKRLMLYREIELRRAAQDMGGLPVEPARPDLSGNLDYQSWFMAAVDDMRPRWKAEAEACIAKHGLVVYGDDWKGATG